METNGETTEKTNTEENASEKIIRHHVYGAMGVGLIPVPIADFLGLTAIQINMLRKIARLYDIPFSKDTVKNVLSSLIGGAFPTTVSPFAASLVKAIPVIGQTTGTVAMPVIAGATTYAVGKVFDRHFASGGTFLSFDPKKVKDYYDEMFKKGEKIVADMKKKKEQK
jgi:uncharacterized protein (DUF697 family)